MGTVSYLKQPGIHRTRGSIPLAGNSNVYTVSAVLWPDAVEDWIAQQFVGSVLHVCPGKSQLGDVRVDLYEADVDIKADAAKLPFADRSFDTYLADVPYNGKMGWMHQTINEAIRIARRRIIWQSWFLLANKDGYLKKAHVFELHDVAVVPSIRGHEDEIRPALYDAETGKYLIGEEFADDDQKFKLTNAVVWQSQAYFGRAQIIQVYDRVDANLSVGNNIYYQVYWQLPLPTMEKLINGITETNKGRAQGR